MEQVRQQNISEQEQNDNQEKEENKQEDHQQELDIQNIINDQNNNELNNQNQDQTILQYNEDLNFVKHEKKISEEDEEPRQSMADIYQEKQIKFKLINKYIKGVAIVDIHQLSHATGLNEIQDPKTLKYEILRSMRSLQRQANYFYNRPIDQDPLKIEKERIRQPYKEQKMFEARKEFDQERMIMLNVDDIYNIATFTQFNINKEHWPYLVSYEISLQVPVEVEQSKNKMEFIMFCEFSHPYGCRNYEIFDAFQPHQVNLQVNFWNDDIKTYSKEVFQQKVFQAKKIFSEQQKLVNSLEITEDYFNTFYKKLINIGAGGFAEVDLYYDTIKDRLLAVKQPVDALDRFQRSQGYDRVPITLLEEERQRIIKAIRELKFEDKQIKQLYIQQRNILREIKRLYQLSSQVQDNRVRYINKLEGVVLYNLHYKHYLPQRMPVQKKNTDNGNQQSVKLIFQYFGGCEYNNKALTCDLQMYFLRNKHTYVNVQPEEKTQIIQSIYKQIFESLEFLHDQQVMLRDLKDDNILIRRKFKAYHPKESQFEILFIDFGMSKKNKLKIPLFDVEISRRISIPYDQNGIVFRHPRFIYGQDKFEKKDDIFALGIMLLRLYDNIEFPLLNINQKVKNLASYICGIPYSILQTYYSKSARPIVEKKCMEYYDKIPKTIKDIKLSKEYKEYFDINN